MFSSDCLQPFSDYYNIFICKPKILTALQDRFFYFNKHFTIFLKYFERRGFGHQNPLSLIIHAINIYIHYVRVHFHFGPNIHIVNYSVVAFIHLLVLDIPTTFSFVE